MNLLIEGMLFTVGALFAIWWFGLVVLPVIYGFPLSFFWAMRGWVKWYTPFLFLINPFLWSALLFGLAYILLVSDLIVAVYIYNSVGSFLGQWFGMLLCIGRIIFSKSAQKDIRDDYIDFVKHYLTGKAPISS